MSAEFELKLAEEQIIILKAGILLLEIEQEGLVDMLQEIYMEDGSTPEEARANMLIDLDSAIAANDYE